MHGNANRREPANLPCSKWKSTCPESVSQMLKPSNSGRVLVLGEDTRNFLAVIRSLGRSGLDVHVAWCPLNSPALKSKYIRRCHILPEYRSDDAGWLEAFNALLREEQFELILPCTDGTILPLQMFREQLEDGGRTCLLPADVYRICASKDETYRLASQLEIPLPAQLSASTIGEVRTAAADFGYPLVLKPRTSSSVVNPLSRQAVRKIRRPEDLESAAQAMLGQGEILVQQNFMGRGVGVEVLCKNGEILTAFQHERVHEPLLGGGSSYRKSVPLHPGMLDATHRLIRELRYTGVAMVEYKYNPATGAWVLIEINARFWGSLPLSIAAGLDFPRYLYEMLCRDRTDFPQQYRTGLYARHWSLDLQWMLDNLRADHSNPDLLTVPWLKVASEIWNIVRLRERSDTFVWDDPKPAVADLAGFCEQMTFAVAKRVSLLRKWGRRRAHRAGRGARNVLFVCHGNICRSPFAAAALARIARERLTVASAGYFPKAQRRAPDAAVTAAAKFGIDLEAHRSALVTLADTEAADVIFVFDRANIDALTARFPQARSKMHLLGALDPSGPLEISDPYGGSVGQFLNCYARILRILQDLFGKDCPAKTSGARSQLLEPSADAGEQDFVRLPRGAGY